MHGKLIFIFLTCLFAFYLLIAPVNAQNTTIKWYKFDEGIDLAKSTGKPIAIWSSSYWERVFDEIATSEVNNNFINIVPSRASAEPDERVSDSILRLGNVGSGSYSTTEDNELLILDSDGREITRIIYYYYCRDCIVQVDADGKIVREIQIVPRRPGDDKNISDFYYETLKYAENKKGKIQRLPQEMGLVSLKDLLTDKMGTGKYFYNYVTVSGFIRDIKSWENGYLFAIDDGTDVTHLKYIGGLGDIKESDKVFVKIFWPEFALTVSRDKIPTKISPTGSDGSPSAPKTPGFGVTIGVVVMFFVSRKIIKRR